jgi:hypothetical protein
MGVRPPRKQLVDRHNNRNLYKSPPELVNIRLPKPSKTVDKVYVLAELAARFKRDDMRGKNEYRDKLLARKPENKQFSFRAAGKNHNQEHLSELIKHENQGTVYNNPGTGNAQDPDEIHAWVLSVKNAKGNKLHFDDDNMHTHVDVIVSCLNYSYHQTDTTKDARVEDASNFSSSQTKKKLSSESQPPPLRLNDRVEKIKGKGSGEMGEVVEVSAGVIRVEKDNGKFWNRQATANFRKLPELSVAE